jgi:hypothetical protein
MFHTTSIRWQSAPISPNWGRMRGGNTQCPYEYGAAVYLSRGLLHNLGYDEYFLSDCEKVLSKDEQRFEKDIPVSAEIIFPGVRIYPNPAKDILYVKSDLENFEYAIISILGNVVSKGKLFKSETQIDVSNINSGVYFLVLKSENGKFIEKLIIK